jgi:hypothetical protein
MMNPALENVLFTVARELGEGILPRLVDLLFPSHTDEEKAKLIQRHTCRVNFINKKAAQ